MDVLLVGSVAVSASVTGFGCRPMTSPSTRTEGRCPKAAREGRRGRWGTRLSGQTMEIWPADAAQRARIDRAGAAAGKLQRAGGGPDRCRNGAHASRLFPPARFAHKRRRDDVGGCKARCASDVGAGHARPDWRDALLSRQRSLRVARLLARQILAVLQRRQVRSPDHWLLNGVLQRGHGRVFGSSACSGSGAVRAYDTSLLASG